MNNSHTFFPAPLGSATSKFSPQDISSATNSAPPSPSSKSCGAIIPSIHTPIATASNSTSTPSSPVLASANVISTSHLIQISGLSASNAIEIENVFSNGLHSLKRLCLKNLVPHPVQVTLGSSLGDQLAFQLSNENLPDDMDTESRWLPTNTVSCARAGGSYGGIKEHEFNALFNSVMHISHLVLQPLQSMDVILLFKPDLSRLSSSQPTTTSSPQQLPHLIIEGISSHADIFSSSPIVTYKRVNIDGFVTFDARIDDDYNNTNSISPSPLQLSSLPFHTSACKSYFSLSPPQEDATIYSIDFGDAGTKETYIQDFSIVNESEIDLFWALDDPQGHFSSVDPDSHIVIIDLEKGHWIGTDFNDWPKPRPVPPLSTRRLRLVFRSAVAKEVDFEFSIENLQDSCNSIRAHVHASVSAIKRDDLLTITSGKSLDFGECVSGLWTSRYIKLKSNVQVPLDVSFSAEPGFQVEFNLAEENIGGGMSSMMMEQLDDNNLPETSNSRSSPVPVMGSHTKSIGGVVDDTFVIPNSARPKTPPYDKTSQKQQQHQNAIVELSRAGASEFEDDIERPASISDDYTTPLRSNTNTTSYRNQITEYTSSHSASPSDLISPPSSAAGSRSIPLHSSSINIKSKQSYIRTTDDEFSSVDHHHHQSTGGASTVSEGYHLSSNDKLPPSSHSTRIEDLVLRPGVEYCVVISFRPVKATDINTIPGGRMSKVSFKLTLRYRKLGEVSATIASSPPAQSHDEMKKTVADSFQQKTVTCKAKACTSFIEVKPKNIDFGEATVGTSKQTTVTVYNLSETTARVDLRYVSKVISAVKDAFNIPPLGSQDIRIDFLPRRVNEKYRKQIIIANNLNRLDDQTIQVSSRNVDKQRIALHSLFYRILTSSGGNFVDFGNVPINSLIVRAITIENLRDMPLNLEFNCSHGEDVRLYVRNRDQQVVLQDLSTCVCPVNDDGQHLPSCSVASVKQSPKISTKNAGAARKEQALDIFFPSTSSPVKRSKGRTRSLKGSASRALQMSSSSCLESFTPLSSCVDGHENSNNQNHQRGSSKLREHDHSHHNDNNSNYNNQHRHETNIDQQKPDYLDLADSKKDTSSLLRRSSLPPSAETLPYKVNTKVTGITDVFSPLRETQTTVVRGSRGFPSAAPKTSFSLPNEDPFDAAVAPSIITSSSNRIRRCDPSTLDTSSPALTGRRHIKELTAPFETAEELSLDQILVSLEQLNAHPDPSSFENATVEDSYVRNLVRLRRRFEDAVQSEELLLADTLMIPPLSSKTIYVVLQPNQSTRPHVQNTYRKQDSRLFMRLLNIDMDAIAEAGLSDDVKTAADVPTREVMLRSNVCRSIFEVGQAHINFSQLQRGEQRTKKIVIRNESECPLVYCIRKSGSIASGDIKLPGGRHGLVPGFGKKEVEFIFAPSMSGRFDQTIWIENVEDEDTNQAISVKAVVKRIQPFSVNPSSLDFGDCVVCEMSKIFLIHVSNDGKSAKNLVIALDPAMFRFRTMIIDVVFEPVGTPRPNVGKAEEEEVEKISQKLVIARRKGQDDKAEKYIKRLAELGIHEDQSRDVLHGRSLRSIIAPSEGTISANHYSNDSSHSNNNSSGAKNIGNNNNNGSSESSNTVKLKRLTSSLTFNLGTGETQTISVTLFPRSITTATVNQNRNFHERLEACINLHEERNLDIVSEIKLLANINCDNTSPDFNVQYMDRPDAVLLGPSETPMD